MAGHIFIYGGIGLDVRSHEISSEDVRKQIDENKTEDELIVHLISPGGDVFEGEAIYNALKNTGKKITTHIEGTCASIATLIAAAGDTIVMNKTARFMIHNPKITGISSAADSRDLRHVADQLDQIKTLLINVYDTKTSLGKEKLWELYDNETWLTADQAEQMGFVDESVDAIKAVAKVDLTKFKMKDQKTFWAAVKNMLSGTKIKNNFEETLQDGTAIVVISEDENWTGKPVVTAEGAPVPDGEHTLASGKVIVVAGGVISEVKQAAADAAPSEAENKIKELEAQLASAKAEHEASIAAAQAAADETVKVKAKAATIENRLEMMEADFLKLKEEALKPIGDTKPVNKGDGKPKNTDLDPKYDPMGEDALKYFQGRNVI